MKPNVFFVDPFFELTSALKSSDNYWPEPEPVALRATGQVSTLKELE